MMHPDQIYNVRQLQHQDLHVEVEQARASRELAGSQSTGAYARLAMWLRRIGVRRLRGDRVNGVLAADSSSNVR